MHSKNHILKAKNGFLRITATPVALGWPRNYIAFENVFIFCTYDVSEAIILWNLRKIKEITSLQNFWFFKCEVKQSLCIARIFTDC